jgi:aminopeptidase-like protein
MSTLNIAVAEIIETGEISKRTVVELNETDWDNDNIPYHNAMELEGLAYHLVETMTEDDKLSHIKSYNSEDWNYTDWDNEPEWEDE